MNIIHDKSTRYTPDIKHICLPKHGIRKMYGPHTAHFNLRFIQTEVICE